MARLILENSVDGIINRRRWMTQTEMAARLGTVLDVVNRALNTLAEDGLIRVERQMIQILNRKTTGRVGDPGGMSRNSTMSYSNGSGSCILNSQSRGDNLMTDNSSESEKLSPWWRNTVILVMIVGFSILIGLTVRCLPGCAAHT